MKIFKSFIVFQLFIYLLISPFLRDFLDKQTFNFSLFISVFAFIFIYIKSTPNLEAVNEIGLKNEFVFNVMIFGFLIFSIYNPNEGRQATSYMGDVSANKSIDKVIIEKLIIYSSPLLLFYSFKQFEQKKIISFFTIPCIIVIISLINGIGQKGPVIVVFILTLTLFNFKLNIKNTKAWIFVFLMLIFFYISALLRYYSSNGAEGIDTYLQRVDGLEFVLNNPKDLISNFEFANKEYFLSIFIQYFRFVSGDYLDLVALSINGPKSLYLYSLGFTELDANFSFLSEGILLFGYFWGFIISLLVLIIIHKYAFKFINSKKVLIFSIGYSLLFNTIMIERGTSDYLTSFFKIMPFCFFFTFLFLRLDYNKK